MSRRDNLHFPVRRALEKDGWTITNDPLVLVFRELRLQADLGAEKGFVAEKDGRRIAVEVKDFDSDSAANELQKMIGQLQLYQWALEDEPAERDLFLAVSEQVYNDLFVRPSYQAAVERKKIHLVVFDPIQEVVLQWIKQ